MDTTLLYAVLGIFGGPLLIILKLWRDIRPGYIRVVMWSPRTMRVSTVWVKIPAVGATKRGEPVAMHIRSHMYDYYPERVYQQSKYMGIISIPSIEYVEGKATPIDHIGDGSAISEGERAEQQILHEAFAAFRTEMSQQMMLILIVGAILLVGGGLYWQWNDKISGTASYVQQMHKAMGLDATPTATPKPGERNAK